MPEPKKELREREYNDEIPDPDEETPDVYEETYRDGTAKHECWKE